MRWRRELPGLPEPEPMSYVCYNPNPRHRSTGDCVIRALSKALGQSWEETYAGLALEGFIRGDLPNADSVWGPYLRKRGFVRRLIPDDGLGAYTVTDFSRDNPSGTYILSMPGHHVVAVVDGEYCDSWDSGGAVPSYYWTKED